MKTYLIVLLNLILLTFLGCSTSDKNNDPLENIDANGVAATPDSADVLEEGLNDISPKTTAPPPAASSSTSSVDGYKKFMEALRTKRYSAASDAAAEVLVKDPKDIRILNGLSLMFIQQGKYEMARMFISKVLARDPKNAMAYNNLGIVEMRVDNLRSAIANFKKAIDSDSKSRAAHANLGVIHLQYRNYNSSVEELQHAVNNGDDSPETLTNLGFALRGVGKYSQAESTYQKALDKDPQNISTLLNYTTLLVEHTQDKSKANKFLNKLRQYAKDSATIEKANTLARMLESGGKQGGKNP